MLQLLPLTSSWDEPPADVAELIQIAAQWEDAFLARRALRPVVSFHSSNFTMVHHALAEIVDRNWAQQNARLLEWGSGLGVVSCLWSRRGGPACGIEADRELTVLARKLAAAFSLDARFVCGNFMPPEAWSLVDSLDDPARLTRDGPCGYELLDAALDQFAIVFAYPWPGERRLIEDVFDQFAAPGALLLSFHGGDELRLQRKA